jgi:serine/threonine protein kinase
VALKLVPAGSLDYTLGRFQREVEALLRLDHHNIVAIVDSGFGDGRSIFWLAMEQVVGRTLESWMHEGAIGADQARSWFEGLADALAHSHQKGLVHRDVNPVNVVVRRNRCSSTFAPRCRTVARA